MSLGARHTGMDCSLNGYDIQYFKHYITFIKIFSKIKKKRKAASWTIPSHDLYKSRQKYGGVLLLTEDKSRR